MVHFSVSGPYVIPVYQGKNGRIVRTEEGDAFFKQHPSASKKRGCYILAMRAGGGITPTYIGKATKTFGQECFSPHKLGKCNESLVDYERGTLIMFLVEAPDGKGPTPAKQIGLLETFLIQTGVSVNDELLNVKGTKEADWSIKGIIRSPSMGRPHKPISDFKKTFHLE